MTRHEPSGTTCVPLLGWGGPYKAPGHRRREGGDAPPGTEVYSDRTLLPQRNKPDDTKRARRTQTPPSEGPARTRPCGSTRPI